MLGPDLSINGDVGEADADGTPSGDAGPQPAQESQTSPTVGNSMLGKHTFLLTARLSMRVTEDLRLMNQ